MPAIPDVEFRREIELGEGQSIVLAVFRTDKKYGAKLMFDIRRHVSNERYTGPTKAGIAIPLEEVGVMGDEESLVIAHVAEAVHEFVSEYMMDEL